MRIMTISLGGQDSCRGGGISVLRVPKLSASGHVIIPERQKSIPDRREIHPTRTSFPRGTACSPEGKKSTSMSVPWADALLPGRGSAPPKDRKPYGTLPRRVESCIAIAFPPSEDSIFTSEDKLSLHNCPSTTGVLGGPKAAHFQSSTTNSYCPGVESEQVCRLALALLAYCGARPCAEAATSKVEA